MGAGVRVLPHERVDAPGLDEQESIIPCGYPSRCGVFVVLQVLESLDRGEMHQ